MMLGGDKGLSESEIYKELGALTKDKSKWKESIKNPLLRCHKSNVNCIV